MYRKQYKLNTIKFKLTIINIINDILKKLHMSTLLFLNNCFETDYDELDR